MKYYDTFGHEMSVGNTVGFDYGTTTIYGTIIEIIEDETTKDGYYFVVNPNIGWRGVKEPNIKRTYKVKSNKIYLIIVKKS